MPKYLVAKRPRFREQPFRPRRQDRTQNRASATANVSNPHTISQCPKNSIDSFQYISSKNVHQPLRFKRMASKNKSSKNPTKKVRIKTDLSSVFRLYLHQYIPKSNSFFSFIIVIVVFLCCSKKNRDKVLRSLIGKIPKPNYTSVKFLTQAIVAKG